MSETNCNHDCGSCSESCSSRQQPESFIESPNQLSCIKKVIGVVSGKGGVGKSLVTSMLAVLFNRRGYNTAIIDADITGPSIPKAFGLKDRVTGNEAGMYPVRSKKGIDVVSINLMLEDEKSPVVWRGPIIANMVKQFWTDVVWSDVDFMFVDMPPGTGDVPLTVFQSIPLDGIVVVTSPQELVSMIVSKAVNMAKMMNIPVLGLIENYSYFECPGCKERTTIFGESHIEETAKEFGLDVLAKLPINPEFAKLSDSGLIELFEGDFLDKTCDLIEERMK